MSPPVLNAKPFALRFERRADIHTFIGVRFTCMNIIVTARSVIPGVRRPLLRGVERPISHALVFLWSSATFLLGFFLPCAPQGCRTYVRFYNLGLLCCSGFINQTNKQTKASPIFLAISDHFLTILIHGTKHLLVHGFRTCYHLCL